MANGNGSPVEVSKIVRDIGFPAVVALILLAAMMGWAPSPMLNSHVRIETMLANHARDDGTRTFLLRRICQNGAISKEDQIKCLQDSEFPR